MMTGIPGIPTETVTLALPRLWTGNASKPAVIVCPGSGERYPWSVQPIAAPLTNALVAAGFPVACATPIEQWGNDNARNWITSIRTYMQSPAVGAKPGKIGLVGLSQGACNVLSWAGANPTLTGAITGYLPATNLQSFKSVANAAYGDNYNEATMGATYNPQTMAAAGKYAGIPIELVHASNDTIVPLSMVQAFKNAVGANAVMRNGGATGHEGTVITSDPTILPALISQMNAIT